MQRGLKWIIGGVIVAIVSYLIMRGMYIIDPMTRDTGYLTTLVFIFFNFPLWIYSGLMGVYGIFCLVKDREKIVKKDMPV